MRGEIYRLRAPERSVDMNSEACRYGVVVQADSLLLSTWLVALTSTSVRPTSFRPEIEIDGKLTKVLVEQTAAVDLQRLGDLAGQLTLDEQVEVDAALRVVLGLR